MKTKPVDGIRWGRAYATLAAFALVLLGARQTLGVTITGDAAKGWRIDAKTYAAEVTGMGELVSLVVDKTEMLGSDAKKVAGAAFPGGKPADVVNLRGQTIAARNANVRVEYTFDDTGIGVECEGAAWNCNVTDAITAFVSEAGVKPGSTRGLGQITRIIVGQTGIEFSEGFHCVARRIFPSAVPSGAKKPEDLAKFRLECGISADATALIEVREFTVSGSDPKVAPQIKAGDKAKYTVELANLGSKDRTVVPAYTLGDHYVGGKVGKEVVSPEVAVAAGKTANFTVEAAPDAPGVHWLNLELKVDGKTLKRERRAFVYAGEKYLPKLTRPDDFREFWSKQLKTLREEPMKAEATEVKEKGTPEAGYYTLTLTVRATKYTMTMSVPRKPGKHMAVFGGKIGETATDAERLIVNLPHGSWPEQATYKRWVTEADNNLMDCYLVAVRITDYLRERPDVDRIYLSGGSRQGAIQLVNAALDPTKICATEPHVPTCLGISWPDYEYKGWGASPKPPTMAAYVDPVNFAPDMTVPFIIDLGAYDGLSPVPGGLAFYNYAAKAPWKRFSVELGGHGYFTSGFKKKAKAEVDELLKTKASVGIDEKVLKEH